jgi:capsular polysaccharide transport system permease protein
MTTIDVPGTAGRDKSARRRTWLARSAILFILGPALFYALYLILLAPAQFQTSTAFAVRGAEAAPIDAFGALGIAPPSANTLDARIVEEFIRSNAMVEGLRERYGFEEAYSRFSLDPFSFLPANADHETATRFWRGKVRVMHDAASQSAMVEVSAFTPEDSLRLSQGVLTLSEELVNRMSDRAMDDLVAAAGREIERKREEYETARDRLAEYQGQRFSGVDVATPAQQAMALVGSIDSQLAQKRTELATMSQTYQPDAPQLTGLQREIAALETERARAVQRAMSTPGEQASSRQIEAQAVLMDYEVAQQAYAAALQAAESVRRQSINDRKYVVAYVPPREPEQSNWWRRLGNVFAVLIGSALLWGVGALIYSIIRDHME